MSLAPRSFSRSTAATAEFAGGQHRRDHDHQPLGRSLGALKKYSTATKRLRIAIEADMGDARGRHQIEHALHEGHAGAQDRREHQLLAGDLRRLHARQRRLDLDIGQRQIARDLVAQQHADLLEELAKRLGRDVLVAQQRQLVLHQRVIDDRDAFHDLMTSI